MSYVLTAYLVDLAALKSVMGSKDESILEDVEPVIAETYEDDEEEADVQTDAVHALVMGERLDPGNAAAYGNALWNICKAVADEELLPDVWGGVRWDAVEACGLVDLLTKTGPPVKLPPNQDIPHIGFIARDKIPQYIQAAENTKAETDKPGVEDLLDEYLQWLETARSEAKDIVFFYG